MRADPAHFPIVCLVTDRRRAYQGSDRRGATAALVAQATWAADAAIDLVQVRERDLEAAALADLVREILDAVRGSATRVIVNDRLDVAIAADAHGVHLRGDSMPCARARRIAPAAFLVGRSVHTVVDARTASAGADCLIAGTVFSTTSKPGRERLLGLEGLHEIARAVSVPVLAIGGMTAERVAAVARSGAAGIAAIGLFLGEGGPTPLAGIVERVRREFAAGMPSPSR